MDIEPGDLVQCINDEQYCFLRSEYRDRLPFLDYSNWGIKNGEIYTVQDVVNLEQDSIMLFYTCCGISLKLEEAPRLGKNHGYAIERFRKIDKKKFEHLLEVSIDTEKELAVEET